MHDSMFVAHDRIIDDGKKGFTFPLFSPPGGIPTLRSFSELENHQSDTTSFCSIQDIGESEGMVSLTPHDEKDILEQILKQYSHTRLHIIDWSGKEIVKTIREYYTLLGYYDPHVKQCSSTEKIQNITIGTTLMHLSYSESDRRIHPEIRDIRPPIRSTGDRKEIIAGVNEGLIFTASLPESYREGDIRDLCHSLIYEEYISPFRLGQVLCYGYEKIGLQQGDRKADTMLSVNSSNERVH